MKMHKCQIRATITREEILQTAKTLFLTKGFEQTTMNDIADSLDLSNTVCREYFPTTDQLLEELWSQ